MIRTALALLPLSIAVAAVALAAPDEGESAVRAVLAKYLESATVPGKPSFDPELFGEETLAFWSDGKAYDGRKAATYACVAAWRELAREFVEFRPVVHEERLVVSGDFAWFAGRVDLAGTLTGDRGEFRRTIRSTFVFEKTGGRWRIVHEHSSRVPR
jgi:ketosteroid isomerase-like protein